MNQPGLRKCRLFPYQTYSISARIPTNAILSGIYWDTADPYHYFRVDQLADYGRLILGGEDHSTGQSKEDEQKHFTNLEQYVQQLFPKLQYTVERRWSGQVLETADGLPFIGESIIHPQHYLATGFAGNGMTFGIISAGILRDKLTEQPNAWSDFFSLKRFKGTKEVLRQGAHYVKEMVAGRLTFSLDGEELPQNSGKIVRHNGKMVRLKMVTLLKLWYTPATCCSIVLLFSCLF